MKTNLIRLLAAFCLTIGLLGLLPVSPVSAAATITVTTCNDLGDGSLRKAMADAADGDTIDFGLDCPASGPITLVTSLYITKNLTISGLNHEIVISGNNTVRVFLIDWGKTVTLEYLSLKNAWNDGGAHGGAIYDNGSYLTLSHMTFDGNQAGGDSTRDGGAIYHNSNGSLTISDSVFTNNSTTRYGGAISTQVNTNITDSTFTGNNAQNGGALMTSTSSITISLERVTMNGNTTIGPGLTYGVGGALYVGFATLNISNSTLSGNGSGEFTAGGGAIYAYDTVVTIKNSTIVNNVTLSFYNTILANNAVDDCYSEAGLTVANNVNNLVEINTSCGTAFSTADPNLGALADNGGKTKTHALLSGSPAIDTGNDTNCLTTDQRELTRPSGTHCDIGAYEYQWVSISGNADVGSATLTYTDGTTKHVHSAVDGTYSIYVPPSWSGTVTPTKTNVTFNPVSRTYTSVTTNKTSQNYVAKFTVSFASYGTKDGWILESTETSNTGGTKDYAATTFRLGDTTLDRQYRAILSFSTSSLPDDAIISSAILKIKQSGTPVGSNPFTVLGTLKVDIANGYFGAYALELTDFNATATYARVANFSATPVSNWYSATLPASGRNNINKTGITQFRLYFSTDDNDDGDSDYMKFISGDYVTSTYRPQLVIQYTLP
jgi:predicted outer membrane repeat protein